LGDTLRLVLEAIIANTALWADQTCIEQIDSDPLKKLTLAELDRLQHAIGELRMVALPMLSKVKYAGDEV